MPDIFGRSDADFGGAIAADTTTVKFSDLDQPGLILQQVNLTYAQNVSRLYGLEDGKVYYVAGRTEGQAGAQQILGPKGSASLFYEKFSDVCNAEGNQIQLAASGGCPAEGGRGGTNGFKLTLHSPVITSVNLEVRADNMIINTGLQMIFVSLSVSDQ